MISSVSRNVTSARASKAAISAASLGSAEAWRVISGNTAKMSDEQFKEKITQMAKRDVAAGVNSRFANGTGGRAGSDEWYRLLIDYTIAKSPDRKSIIEDVLRKLTGRRDNRKIITRTPFYRGELLEAMIKNGSIKSIIGDKDVGENFINFRDSNGEMVATYSTDTGWHLCATDSEKAREQEFFKMWDTAISDAIQEREGAVYM